MQFEKKKPPKNRRAGTLVLGAPPPVLCSLGTHRRQGLRWRNGIEMRNGLSSKSLLLSRVLFLLDPSPFFGCPSSPGFRVRARVHVSFFPPFILRSSLRGGEFNRPERQRQRQRRAPMQARHRGSCLREPDRHLGTCAPSSSPPRKLNSNPSTLRLAAVWPAPLVPPLGEPL